MHCNAAHIPKEAELDWQEEEFNKIVIQRNSTGASLKNNEMFFYPGLQKLIKYDEI